MSDGRITFREDKDVPQEPLARLYRENHWTNLAAEPAKLHQAILNSHAVITAWEADTLVGLGNAISDGAFIVFYSHLLVLPSHQRRGIGSKILERLQRPYAGFNQQVLITDPDATAFYRKLAFSPVAQARAEALWIHRG